MVATCAEFRIGGKIIFWDVTCRTEKDWYATTYTGERLSDHHETRQGAIDAALEKLKQMRKEAEGK